MTRSISQNMPLVGENDKNVLGNLSISSSRIFYRNLYSPNVPCQQSLPTSLVWCQFLPGGQERMLISLVPCGSFFCLLVAFGLIIFVGCFIFVFFTILLLSILKTWKYADSWSEIGRTKIKGQLNKDRTPLKSVML